MTHTATSIQIRIDLLKGRKRDNGRIIRKLERQLRKAQMSA